MTFLSLCPSHQGWNCRCMPLCWLMQCAGDPNSGSLACGSPLPTEPLPPLVSYPLSQNTSARMLVIPSGRFYAKTTGTLALNLEIFSQFSRSKDHPICNPKTPSSGLLRLNQFGNAVCFSHVKWLALKVNTDWNMV